VERIGHRGAKREFPENTIAAFVRAFEHGADAVELDVHATADHVIVVHHDADINGAPIRALSWAQVQAVQFGPGIGIPTLADVLAATPADRTLYVELKGEGIEREVAELLMPRASRAAIHSFDHAAIERLSRIAPDVPRGILYDDVDVDVAAAVARTGARDVWPEWPLIDEALVDRVHDLGCRVIAWTVNRRDVAEYLADIGVDGLCGDDVRLLQVSSSSDATE
jgi:glycerophosphoryl diester phosphodiesterase